MVNKFTYRDVEWIDIESPTYEEIKAITTARGLNRLLAQELLAPTLKPKVDLYRDYIYLVLHFPAIRHSHSADSANQEIDFVIGKNFIITTHYDTVDPLHEFSKIFEVNAILDRSDMGEHACFIFYHMIKHIYKGMVDELDGIKGRLSAIETNIFSGRETAMVGDISKISKDILDIKGTLRPHGQVLDSLEIATIKLFGSDFTYPMRALKNESYRVKNEILHCSDLVRELRETNNTLVSTKQNETMKQLAVIASIALPVAILTGLLQIDTVSRPIVGVPGDFWIILFFMGLLAALLYSYSKAKKWL
ncbi:MAG: hypothetical protein A3C06_01820 [Candidatus Taylorbacteria bacterium RIFCSPHIGHO2_02_FULL_46_13]|uniref:Magnesium transporter CorA n=1 Tax=Candidatus Taylorbacteria bacterium RIFCSPHIGHO2_02_FULL_46_13 TaxID=1802312 RepID=A0A1G2MUJ7_9BACT|nr:MAG: hypothetical protein A3C06_01820 [Candidatus Taylorbacteria bacterium RIFCSPHIGHO2_02_FULL_46_13]